MSKLAQEIHDACIKVCEHIVFGVACYEVPDAEDIVEVLGEEYTFEELPTKGVYATINYWLDIPAVMDSCFDELPEKIQKIFTGYKSTVHNSGTSYCAYIELQDRSNRPIEKDVPLPAAKVKKPKKVKAVEEDEEKSDITAPRCTNCGAVMVQRKNKTTAAPFWGCPRFPKCKGSRPIIS